MNYSRFFLICFVSLIIFSCSEDDNSDSGNPEPGEPQLQTGVFVDSEVGGLTYETATQNGITNENGEFVYFEGEIVTFSVGIIELGSAEGASQLTPISIASTPDATVESQEVKNIAAFLQSLDSDADPSNGITIEAAVVEAINVNEIDFTGNIVNLLGEMVAEINLVLDSSLEVVYPEVAAMHMAESLGEEYESTDQVYSSFIPRFEGFFSTYGETAYNSIYWIHEINEEGLLTSSLKYEKYPNRIMAKYIFAQHDELHLPKKVQRVGFRNGVETENVIGFDLSYSQENELNKISTLGAQSGSVLSSIALNTIDEKSRPTVLHFYNAMGDFTQRVERIFNENDNIIESFTFETESGDDYRSKREYSYTDFADFEKITDFTDQQTSYNDFTYRDDNTLEKRITTYSTSNAITTLEYDENELILKAILDWEWTTVIRWFHDNGVRSKEEHYDAEGNLTRIDTFDENGNLISSETV